MFTVRHSKEFVLSELSQLKELKYNQFRWWRRWENKKPLLSKSAPLLDRIQNKDLEFSHYFWQSVYCEIEMNEKSIKCLDPQHWVELTQLDRARRKRLIEDFEKDETEKLKTIEDEFQKEFFMTKEDYYEALEGFDGSLEDFYHFCTLRYKKRARIKSRRGRPSKN